MNVYFPVPAFTPPDIGHMNPDSTHTSDADSAVMQVYQALRRRILAGDLAGGMALRQDEIAQRHGTSKVPVREALRRLEMESLVEFRPRRGAIVRLVSDEELLDMLDIRIALECRALELAVPNMAASDLHRAREILERYQGKEDQGHWSECNRQFHACILEPCGNRQLLGLIADVEQRAGPLLRLRITEAAGLDRPMKEHAAILACCERDEALQAVQLLREHIETTQREVAAAIRRRRLD